MDLFRRGRERGQKVALAKTFDIVRRYVIQETLEPLKNGARLVGFGLGGAILTGLGGIIALVGVLRLLQGETGGAFYGNWSFAPYALTTLVAAVVILVVVKMFFGTHADDDR